MNICPSCEEYCEGRGTCKCGQSSSRTYKTYKVSVPAVLIIQVLARSKKEAEEVARNTSINSKSKLVTYWHKMNIQEKE